MKQEGSSIPEPFGLASHQVPDFPESTSWKDVLRWLIMVMDNDDSSLPFVAGCYAHCLKNEGGITSKQASACNKILRRIHDRYMVDELDCQQMSAEKDNVHYLETVQPEGEA